ncbi:MAG: hemolysin family protein [Candidatus Eisenbacteria bacterium]|nr:hemolysin family protein [Candidatus Eisenbacteria bacterium]
MSPSTLAGLIVIAACVCLSAFFSGSETGVVSLNRIRLRHMIRSGDKRAERLSKLLVQQEGVLAATLIGTNLFNIIAAAVATVLLARNFGAASAIFSTLIVTPILVVFAEVIPKSYFRLRADTAMLSVCRPLSAATFVLTPFVRLTSFFVRSLFTFTGATKRSPFVTREELKSIVRESAERGALRLRERDMLQGVLNFSKTVARDVMIPLREVASIEEKAGVGELGELVRSRGHTRIPVYRERVDEVVGFINVFDVLYDEDRGDGMSRFVRPIPVVPEIKRLDRLLIEMLRARVPIALVVDELGTCAGIVTVEDIIGEIMGELVDEHDAVVEQIRAVGDNEYVIDARTSIDDLNEHFKLGLPKEGYETLGGFILKVLGKLPQTGEQVTRGPAIFEVTDVHRYGIRKIKMTLTAN